MKKYTLLILLLCISIFIFVGCSNTQTEETNDVVTEEENNEILYMDISVEDAQDLIESTPDLVIIDVSPLYGDGHIPNAINYYIGDGSLDAAITSLDKDKTYLVYCHTDAASIAGAQKLVDAGFKNVYRLIGNFGAWVDAGYPIEK